MFKALPGFETTAFEASFPEEKPSDAIVFPILFETSIKGLNFMNFPSTKTIVLPKSAPPEPPSPYRTLLNKRLSRAQKQQCYSKSPSSDVPIAPKPLFFAEELDTREKLKYRCLRNVIHRKCSLNRTNKRLEDENRQLEDENQQLKNYYQQPPSLFSIIIKKPQRKSPAIQQSPSIPSLDFADTSMLISTFSSSKASDNPLKIQEHWITNIEQELQLLTYKNQRLQSRNLRLKFETETLKNIISIMSDKG